MDPSQKAIGAPRDWGGAWRRPWRGEEGGEERASEDVQGATQTTPMDLDAQKAELAQKYSKYQEAAVRLQDLRAEERAASKRRRDEEDHLKGQLQHLEEKVDLMMNPKEDPYEVVKDEGGDDDWRSVVDCPVPDPRAPQGTRLERAMEIAGGLRQQGLDRAIPEVGDRVRKRMKQAEILLLAEEAARGSGAAAPRADASGSNLAGGKGGDNKKGKGSDSSGSNLAGGKGGDNKKGKPIKRGGWMTKALVLAKAVLDDRLVEAKALAECYTFQARAMETNNEEAGYDVCSTEGS